MLSPHFGSSLESDLATLEVKQSYMAFEWLSIYLPLAQITSLETLPLVWAAWIYCQGNTSPPTPTLPLGSVLTSGCASNESTASEKHRLNVPHICNFHLPVFLQGRPETVGVLRMMKFASSRICAGPHLCFPLEGGQPVPGQGQNRPSLSHCLVLVMLTGGLLWRLWKVLQWHGLLLAEVGNSVSDKCLTWV